jgi:anti-anti-sigma factor
MAKLDRQPASATVDPVASGGDTTVVGIVGELDLESVEAIELDLEALIKAAPQRLAFDLSGVTFMDSSGIAMLLRAARRVPYIEVRDPSPIVQMIIRATGLTEVLHAAP